MRLKKKIGIGILLPLTFGVVVPQGLKGIPLIYAQEEQGLLTHTVLPGDTYSLISERLGIPVQELEKMDQLLEPGNTLQYQESAHLLKVIQGASRQERFYDLAAHTWVDKVSQRDQQVFKQGFSQLGKYIEEEPVDTKGAVQDILGTIEGAKQESEGVVSQDQIKELEDRLKELEENSLIPFSGGIALPQYTKEEAQQLYDLARHNAPIRQENYGLLPHVAVYKEFVGSMFGITSFSLYRPGDWQDHGKGKAIDFMVPVASTLGDQLASYAISTMDYYGVSYVIWKQHIYGNWNRQWVPMEDRGSITQNHYDHVHVSFS